MLDVQQRASGCLFGLAFGDALGAATEFLDVATIIQRFGPKGPQDLSGNPARVTDDTQMTLAVGEALMQAERPYSLQSLEGPLRAAFIVWNESPENNRAPGITCINACNRLKQDIPWQEATVTRSKGCGANMRVAPVGLLPWGRDGVSEKSRAGIAQFQAALTHGHPTALAAADLTAHAIADLASGGDVAELPDRLKEYAHSQRFVYHEEWLGTLWQRAYVDSPEEFIARGWDECLNVLDRLDAALLHADRDADPCLQTGDGWIAEEAFATAMLCFLFYPDEPITAIQRAAVTKGDSDSIACLTGAFAGTYLGLSAWPSEWIQRIEYRERLAQLGALWDK
ncbi:ADP-ribosylglycohydrolase [Thermosporothrix hazakensis]|jgi:ADP-ribosylglycohydrolase|uniref:ADP-ribosylglycohydrolase n=2 Tax=Thermosporothrix TaxID=768650 RepID=A0A326TSM7_THEHA|nr:ADP-ribosylglycohydrolase family protein [Thermosporothrix hazakensis]PZW19390.1 ADP-ribosylglycohydrolase [Thermosporothrix hazakensis]BBH89860.1 hypothetical protein KTC_46110 [Thermosporothrix sp. COM3]GCE48056.1 hypothetical protein KTH_29250 [Thermosporothrix hazakensis]